MTTIETRIARLEAAAPDVDAAIEAELAKMTPAQQAQFLAEFAAEFGLELEQHDSKKDVRNGNG